MYGFWEKGSGQWDHWDGDGTQSLSLPLSLSPPHSMSRYFIYTMLSLHTWTWIKQYTMKCAKRLPGVWQRGFWESCSHSVQAHLTVQVSTAEIWQIPKHPYFWSLLNSGFTFPKSKLLLLAWFVAPMINSIFAFRHGLPFSFGDIPRNCSGEEPWVSKLVGTFAFLPEHLWSSCSNRTCHITLLYCFPTPCLL